MVCESGSTKYGVGFRPAVAVWDSGSMHNPIPGIVEVHQSSDSSPTSL